MRGAWAKLCWEILTENCHAPVATFVREEKEKKVGRWVGVQPRFGNVFFSPSGSSLDVGEVLGGGFVCSKSLTANTGSVRRKRASERGERRRMTDACLATTKRKGEKTYAQGVAVRRSPFPARLPSRQFLPVRRIRTRQSLLFGPSCTFNRFESGRTHQKTPQWRTVPQMRTCR